MSDIKAKIVHLSDLHFGDHLDGLVPHLKDRILEEKPHVIVVSGDILENPPLPVFGSRYYVEEANKFLTGLPVEEQKRILAIGNHDVNFLGNIDLSLLSLELLTGGLGYKSKPPEDLFGLVDTVGFRFFSELGLSFFIFDSTPFRSPFNFAFGTISDNALNEFRSKIKAIENGDKGVDLESFRKSFKIAVLHHHPLPISYSGTEKIALLTNAGTFLQQMLDYEIDLILHGHKHIWAVRRYSSFYGFKDYLFRDILCVSSGSTLKKGAQPFQFNVINIYTDKTVELRCFTADTPESPFVESRKVPLIGYHGAKRRSKRKAVGHLGYKCKCLEKEMNLDQEGDANITIKYIGLEIVGDKDLEFLAESAEVDAGRVARDLDIVYGTPDVVWKEDISQRTWRRRVGKFMFSPVRKKNYAPISFYYSYKTLNSHAMSVEEAEELYKPSRHSAATSHKIRVPCDEFKMRIIMPDVEELLKELNNDTIHLLIYDDEMRPVVSKEKEEHCTYDPSTRSICVKITNPMVYFTYKVQWPLPKKAQAKSGPSAQMIREIQKRLLQLCRKASDTGPAPNTKAARIREALKLFSLKLEKIVTRKWEDEEFDVSLMISNEEKNFVVVSSLFEYTSDVWEVMLPAGVGQVWKAFKSNRCVGPKSEYYVEPQELSEHRKGLVKHEFLLSIPFNFYDDEMAYQIGVINIGSQKDTSYIGDILGEKNETVLHNAVAELYSDVYNILLLRGKNE